MSIVVSELLLTGICRLAKRQGVRSDDLYGFVNLVNVGIYKNSRDSNAVCKAKRRTGIY
jgi:hypothetical protein